MSTSARSVSFTSHDRVRITTDRVTHEYVLEVWRSGGGYRIVSLHRTDGRANYSVVIPPSRNPKQATWSCDCPAAKYKGGQCKHVLALKAGLRSVGCKV